MYRSGAHLCPVCDVALGKEAVTTADLRCEVERCQHCGAAFFSFENGEPSGLARALSPGGPWSVDSQVGRGQPLPCPSCREPMVKHHYLNGPPVHRCGSCLGTLAFPDQLEHLRDFSLLPAAPKKPGKALLTWWETLRAFLL